MGLGLWYFGIGFWVFRGLGLGMFLARIASSGRFWDAWLGYSGLGLRVLRIRVGVGAVRAVR